ncbi:MAG TPA: glycosyltransferase family 2 protein [Candidatus Limnocylindrales bacterium]
MTTPGAGARVLAVIPGYEEGPRIAAVVTRARHHLPVLVVDDGSTDDTAAQAEAAGAIVLPQRPNQGKGAALRMGFRRALAEGYDAVVTLDADGQHDPDEIPAFLAAFGVPGLAEPPGAWRQAQAVTAAGPRPELVIGRRDFARMPMVRRLSNTLGGVAFSWAVGRPIPDNQSGFRLLGRRLMAAMVDSRETGFEFEVEMIAICLKRGWPLDWVPISTIYAGAPSHVQPLHHLRHFVRATRAARRIVRAP